MFQYQTINQIEKGSSGDVFSAIYNWKRIPLFEV
jgi:hypothetical protein